MHPLLKTLIFVVLIGAGGAAAIYWYSTTSTEAAYQAGVTQLQQQWTERLGTVRSISDPARYKEEMRTQLKWYFSELQDLYNRFPDQADTDRAWKQIEEDQRAGRIPADRMDSYKEFFEYAKSTFELMRKGDYVPQINGSAESMHMDIYSVKRDSYEGAPRLRIDFVLWGAPRRIDERPTASGTIKKIRVPIAFSRMFFQFLDADGKVYGEMSGASGEPFIKIDYPERWIAEFPPQAVLGTWWVEMFPKEAEKVDWQIVLTGRTDAGNPINAEFKWEFGVPPAWKTGDWSAGAAEQVMPEEYINRAAAGAE